ncbi:MAG: LEA type 2 family protein [Deltaproteobacteria bacterium]|nr:LEA type 2 family protein [Deltaproteobacteria bacterium]
MTTLPRCTALLALCCLAACPGAQVRETGEVTAVIRRIDVIEADYDKMKLEVVVAVENGTGGDVDVSAEASVAIVGEAKGGDTDEEPKAAAEGEGAEDGDKSAESEDKLEGEASDSGASGGSTPIDGQRHAGSGRGRAAGFNTSELPIVIELPLPSDPALLEELVGWPKMLLHIEGSARVGLKTIRLGGHRDVAPPHLPDVLLKESQVASENEGQAGAGFFKVALDNKNPFDVSIDRFAWSITIKDKELRAAGEGEADKVPGSSVAEYEATVDINEKAFGKELKAILRSPTVPYVVEGYYEVRGIKKTFRFAGDMKFARR